MRTGSVIGCAVAACALAGLVAWGVAAGAGSPASAAIDQRLSHLPNPERVNAETRAELQRRMGRHGNTMSNLVRAVILLDRMTIKNLAGRIADEEIISRDVPRSGGNDRFSLPDEFFTQQSMLSVVAQNLAIAAREGRDDLVLADHFAGLARTCVACHSAYLHGGPFPRPGIPRTTLPPPPRP